MIDSAQNSSDSDYDGDSSDAELQEAFAAGLIKPGLNEVLDKKQFVNDLNGLRQKTQEISLSLPWIEQLDCINKQAPLAPELAAQLVEQETKRENQLKNNKNLQQQLALHEDHVLDDFKREMTFYRQAQATILEAIPKITALGLLTKRPDDYFAEMAKSDEHMQKIREKLMQKQAQQQRSEKVKQLRLLRKEGKTIQMQAKQERQKEKKTLMDQVKKVRKGLSSDMSFLDNKKGGKALSKKQMEKRVMKQKKFGFGGKKRGSKMNTRESAADFSEYDGSKKSAKGFKQQKKSANKRPGKSKRIKSKNKGRK